MPNRNLLTASEVSYLRHISGGDVHQVPAEYGNLTNITLCDKRNSSIKVSQALAVAPTRTNKLLLGYLDFMATRLEALRHHD